MSVFGTKRTLAALFCCDAQKLTFTVIGCCPQARGQAYEAAPIHHTFQRRGGNEGVIAAQPRNPGGGLIVMPDSFNVVNRELIIALTARHGVPAIYWNRFFTGSGGLITYGTDFVEQFRQVPEYIDRILKGEKAADLAVQQPSKFELVINLKTAKTLGLTVPDKLLAIADEVIE